MSFLGERNAIALGVSQHTVLGSGPLLTRLSPSLLLQFAGAQTLDPRITFTRASTATFTGQDGLIQSAAIDAPRFDYNPATLAPLGLLIEGSRTNLLLYSEQFDNAAWTKTRSSITANTIVAPDGTLTGDKLVEDTTANNTHGVNQTFSFSTGSYVYSIYAKAGERTFLQPFRSSINIDSFTHIFNLAAGTVSGTGATIVSVGNGWYRCIGVVNVNTAHSGSIIFGLNNGTSNSYTGNGFSGLFLWGAQLEAGAFATSYIPTVASQVTRAVDVAVMTGTNFSSWYNQSEGSFYLDSDMYETQSTFFRYFLSANNASGSTSEFIGFSQPSNGFNVRGAVTAGGVVSAALNSTTTVGAPFKIALAYKVNDFATSFNGGTVLTDTSGNVPTEIIQLYIGAVSSSGASASTHFRQIVYYPRRLSNAALQGITA